MSCASIKIKGIEIDSTQELIGSVKKINTNTVRYTEYENINNERSVTFYDKKNKVSKEIIYHPNFKEETSFYYVNELLKKTLTKIDKRIIKIEYKYDTNKNILEFNQFENDTLLFTKTSIFDKNNNPIKTARLHKKYKELSSKLSTSEYTYNYKNNTVIIKEFDQFNTPNNNYLKLYFNKKGLTIKTETISNKTDENYLNASRNEYDTKGNLTKRISLNKEGKTINYTEYKNKYDTLGNIILREVFLNGKLYEKKSYDITYW